MRNYYKHGSWNCICDRCGFWFKAEELQKEWTGLMVCNRCWEPRHPQTLIRTPREEIAPPWTRPEPDDVFIEVTYPITTEDYNIITTEAGGANFLTLEG
jgi:hypothetical protein